MGTAAALAAVQVTAEAAPGSASNAPTDLPPSSAAVVSAPSGEKTAEQQQQQQPSSSSSTTTTLLHVALRFWACHQQDLLGASSINAAVAGLAALAALPSPCAVDAVLVRGARVEEEEEQGANGNGVVIRTRSRARAAAARPERWIGVTARAKAVQLLADALVEAAEGGEKLGVGGDDDEGEWDTASDDDDDDDDESDGDESDGDEGPKSRGGNSVAASLARAAAAAGGGAGNLASSSDLFAARAFLDDEDDFFGPGGGGGDSAFDRDPLDPLASASPGEIAARGLKAAYALYPQWMQEVGGALLSAGQRRAVAAAFGVGE